LTDYECEREKVGTNQTNAAMVEMAKKLTLVVTKLKECIEIHKEFIDKLMAKLEEQLEEKKQAHEVGGCKEFLIAYTILIILEWVTHT
jgi:hypothetical protein